MAESLFLLAVTLLVTLWAARGNKDRHHRNENRIYNNPGQSAKGKVLYPPSRHQNLHSIHKFNDVRPNRSGNLVERGTFKSKSNRVRNGKFYQ